MEGATLVEKTRWRLNGLKTLKDWATKSVLSNLDAYTQEGSANHLKIKLSPELRNYVLQELLVIGNSKKCKNMDDFNSLKRSVFALMNNRTYKLDLNILVSSYPSNMNSELVFTEVLRLVSIAAPNVRHLKINTHHITVCSNHIEYRNKSLEYLSSLKELMILEFVGYIHNSMDLVLWCRNLPNLRVLCANGTLLEDTNLTLEDIRLSFGHLSLLHIPFLSSKEIKKIWKVLPNLDILTEQILPNGLTLEDFLGDENFPRERKYLSCEALIYGLNFWADFSSIKYMEFYCCERRWNDFERNHNLPTAIDGLILFMLNSQETVEAVLLKYGANLRWLSLRGLSYQNVDLNHISELCPNLEVLSMTSVRVMGNATKQTYFSHLKELFIERVYMINGSLTAVLSSSPNLRKLKLNVRTCCLDDLQQVKNLIVEKKILGSLQSLDWSISAIRSELVFCEISAIVKIASATLSELRKLNIDFYDLRQSMNNIRYFWSNWPIYIGIREAINTDTNLFEILSLYE